MPKSPNTPIKPWKMLSSSVALNEKWFHIRKDRIQLPSGKIIDDYFVWESPDIAIIVPITTDGRFVLTQEYRHGVGKIMYQFPAGAIDPDETPEAAARRELAEETGYVAKALTPLATLAPYGSKLTGWHHAFLAPKVTATATPAVNEQEVIRTILATPAELWKLIETDEFQVADHLAIALLALRRVA